MEESLLTLFIQFNQKEKLMQIIKLKELSEAVLKNIVELLFNNQVSGSQTREEIQDFITGRCFDFGRFFFAAIEGKKVLATIGAVIAEVARKEIFVTALTCVEGQEHIFSDLLRTMLSELACFKEVKIKFGIRDGQKVGQGFPENLGFRKEYSLLSMKYEGKRPSENSLAQIELKALGIDNIDEYVRVTNQSFLNTSNAASIDEEDAKKMMGNEKLICGLIYDQGVAKGSYELKLSGEDGWIESIGILPEWQGKGLGRAFVEKLIYRLQKEEARAVRLTVIDINSRAYNLYKRMDFKVVRNLSDWYELRV